jgi:hypothetical protein
MSLVLSHLESTQMKPFTIQILRSLFCLLPAASGLAQAHTFCVSSASALQGALTSASDGGSYAGESNSVLVVTGNYLTGSATGNLAFRYHNTTPGTQLLLLGGYNAGCTGISNTGAHTVLDGNHATQVLQIRSGDGEVDVGRLTIQNGEYNQQGAGLSINGNAGDNSPADVFDNIIRNNHTTQFAGGMYVAVGGSGHGLFLHNNLIVGNSADQGGGAGEAIANGSGTVIYNNTIVQNTASTSGATGGLYWGGSAGCSIYSNIFWNNDTYGLYLGGNNANIEYNDYGTLGGNPGGSVIGNVSVAPKFIDASGGDFHLAGDSPLLGVSPRPHDLFDLDGQPYPDAGKVDLGAYEETIFIHGFDG